MTIIRMYLMYQHDMIAIDFYRVGIYTYIIGMKT